MADFLLPIADADALRWIVREQKTAVPATRADDAAKVEPGDRVFLYTTRGCFRNPTRDRGRLIAVAKVIAPARRLARPITFGSREYALELRFTIERLAPRRGGVELAPLVDELATFPDPASWRARLRRALVPLAGDDRDQLVRRIEEIAAGYPRALPTYET